MSTVKASSKTRSNDEINEVSEIVAMAIEAIRSDNFMSYFDFFSEDALWMMPNSSEDVNSEEAKKFYRFTEKFRFDQQVSVNEILLSENIAVVRVSFDGYLVAKSDVTAVPMRSVSRHIWVLKKQVSGKWKIIRDIWNNPKSQ